MTAFGVFMRNDSKSTNSSAAKIGYESELWKTADALRGSMDAVEYKHVVLGLIFLKYISDAHTVGCAQAHCKGQH